ncbi:MAG: DUF1989 domain-containing protein [Alphaproteobacteria bacterium]|nr:DUF1989 domain-containing protein [Alphaproteobacteria bacterium]
MVTAPRVLHPGLPAYLPGVERYRVHGGGSVVVAVAAGDVLTVTDREGRQRCEVAAFLPDGTEDVGALGLAPGGEALGLRAILGDGAGQELLGALRRRGISARFDTAAHLFPKDAQAGQTHSFTAQRDAIVVVGAPGGPMAVDAHDPPTDLDLVIRRRVFDADAPPPLPEPLADPRLELRVDRCTARSYEVREGDYIQVIDVAGRQCSDFLAYHAGKLQAGVERGIDPTTTRYQVGSLYPMPGLASKYFDTDMQPLVEVIRDTCGRHDTFGLACTARFYEDMGYPGHANCSENFNQVLGPFGLAARVGWPAINLYYNTAVNAQNAIFLEEPYSRPGDYVLFRAMTDLVCGSSACPDDIDGTNAWNPTDVHVRIYPAKQSFSKAVAYRMTPDAEPQLTRETAFHPRTAALTRNLTEYRGFWLPTRFNNHGAIDEYAAARERAVVLDLSPLRKFEVTGQDAEELLQRTLTRNVRRLAVGQVVYSAMCYPTGGMIDDGTLFRLGPNLFRWVGGDDYGGIWLRRQAEEMGLKQVWVKSSTDQLHNIAVQGPLSRDILKSVIWTPPAQPKLEEIAWFHFTIGRIGGYNGPAVVVSRTGYTGELGYEVFCHPRDALAVWDAIWEAGKPHGLTPLGLEALDMLRIEAGLIFAGYEFDDQIDPFEAGIGFTVALSKNDDFIGRDALQRRKDHPQRKLVGLELASNEGASHGDCVHVGRMQVGVVTSGTRSPVLGRSIALCRMNVEYARIGTEVEVGKIDGHQKRIPARVVRFPAYDPDKTRPRS